MSSQHYASQAAFKARDDLKQFGDDAFLLFALQIRWGIEYIEPVAADALIDGPDDKKCDLIYVDRDEKVAVVAQSYFSPRERSAAPANKAADLNTATSWVLAVDIDRLPEHVRPAAENLRDAVRSGEIEVMEFWFVHNLPEHENVSKELQAVEHTIRNVLRSQYSDPNCDVRVKEVGIRTVEEWYQASTTPILVTAKLEVSVPGGYELSGDGWKALATAVPATWLRDLYNLYSVQLFSANVRDYLGSRKADSNINSGIKMSAREQPGQFWAYNNGITALVNDYALNPRNNRLTISGLSIVNGAQTTAALGLLDEPPSDVAMVSTRFIKCFDHKVVRNIVRFNNSQNRIEATDFRSGDPVQIRLRKEFEAYGGRVLYRGGRRGGADDIIRRPPNLIPSEYVGQALTAFHQYPVTAYHHKMKIWDSNHDYGRIFHDGTHAEHIVFVYSLFEAILAYKEALKQSGAVSVSETAQQLRKFFTLKGSHVLLATAIGACMEIILQRPVPDRFVLRFRDLMDLRQGMDAWKPLIECCIPFHQELHSPLQSSLGSPEKAREAVDRFRSLVQSSRHGGSESIHDRFATLVMADPWPASLRM